MPASVNRERSMSGETVSCLARARRLMPDCFFNLGAVEYAVRTRWYAQAFQVGSDGDWIDVEDLGQLAY